MLGLSENTVKSFCQRRKLGGVVVKSNAEVTVCKCFGKPIPQNLTFKQAKLMCSKRIISVYELAEIGTKYETRI